MDDVVAVHCRDDQATVVVGTGEEELRAGEIWGWVEHLEEFSERVVKV